MNKLFPALIAAILLLAGCSSTFLVSKDGKGYFWGNNSKAIYRMLCESGDLIKILEATKFIQTMKDDIYKYNCSTEHSGERSGEKVKQIYAALTADQRRALRNAFKSNGYDINYLPC